MFVDLLSWRLVFVINVIPIAVTLMLLGRLPLTEAIGGVVSWAGIRRPGMRRRLRE